MGRVSFYTLGCKLNFAETGALQRDFVSRAYEVVPFGESADVTVINTCTVTSEAERKCRQIIRRALRANPDTFVAVTGCYAQLRPEEISADRRRRRRARRERKISTLLTDRDSFAKREETQIAVSCIDDVASFGPAYSSDERTRAFLKIQDGCDYSCSFCTIPMAQGPKSISIDRCLRDIRPGCWRMKDSPK
jgi:threonylcarbamoyladenosine tRNA methylthiotransferase MtaB